MGKPSKTILDEDLRHWRLEVQLVEETPTPTPTAHILILRQLFTLFFLYSENVLLKPFNTMHLFGQIYDKNLLDGKERLVCKIIIVIMAMMALHQGDIFRRRWCCPNAPPPPYMFCSPGNGSPAGTLLLYLLHSLPVVKIKLSFTSTTKCLSLG